MSNCIENKGQCTAMRHLVVADFDEASADKLYSKVPVVDSAYKSIETQAFAGVFGFTQPKQHDGYTCHKPETFKNLMQYKIASEPPAEIEEEWREVVLDITSVGVRVGFCWLLSFS